MTKAVVDPQGQAGPQERTNFSDSVKKAFDFAQETTKQIIALSTGMIALTITFLHDLVHNIPTDARIYLAWSWVLYIFAVIFGIGGLMAMTGTLDAEPKKDGGRPSVYGSSIRLFAILQIVAFITALSLTVYVGSRGLAELGSKETVSESKGK